MLKPPPIQEPFKLDSLGRLTSIPWVLWLQDLVNSQQAEGLFSETLTLITTTTSDRSSLAPLDSSNESAVQIEMIGATTANTSRTDAEDALLFSWLSF